MKRHLIILFLTVMLLLAPSLPGQGHLEAMHRYEISDRELLAEDYYQMIGPDGEIIMKTGRVIHVDDEYLTADNRLFRVYKVEGKKAYAKYLETIDLQEHMAKNFRAEVRQMLRPALGLAQDGGGEENDENDEDDEDDEDDDND